MLCRDWFQFIAITVFLQAPWIFRNLNLQIACKWYSKCFQLSDLVHVVCLPSKPLAQSTKSVLTSKILEVQLDTRRLTTSCTRLPDKAEVDTKFYKSCSFWLQDKSAIEVQDEKKQIIGVWKKEKLQALQGWQAFFCTWVLQLSCTKISLSCLEGVSLTLNFNSVFSDVCFIRLDFEVFMINGPTDTADEAMGGSCSRDSFTVQVIISSWFYCHH